MIMRNYYRLMSIVLFGLLAMAPVAARAEAEGVVRYGVSPTSLQNDFFENNNDNDKSYTELGYRPARLTGYVDGGSVRYFTRWLKNTDHRAWKGYFGKTLAEFDAIFYDLRAQGYHMVDTSGYETPAGVRFAMLWEKTNPTPGWQIFRNTSVAGMQQLHDTIGQQGWVPHRVEGYELSGQSFYTSLWYYQPGKGYYIHSHMTREQYDAKLAEHKANDYIPHHLHAHAVGNNVWYSAIFKHTTASYSVRSNRDWRVFQRYYNNLWAGGYNIDNFYAAATPDGVRFGGIWFFDGAPAIDENSSLYSRVRKQIDGAPGRGGAAIINLTTGDETMLHADQSFAIASTAKIGILYALMREIDLGNESWSGTINSGAQYGNNQGSWLTANTNYTIAQMAQFMIRSSNNWATNRLIDRIGRTTINNHLADPARMNLDVTRIHRYMVGTGAPSAHGNASSYDDRLHGWENLSTPREMAGLLRHVHNGDFLSATSVNRFWATLALDGDNNGVNNKGYVAPQVTGLTPPVVVFNKAGNNDDVRIQAADAGRMNFSNGQRVIFAIFMDEVSDNPDVPGVASATNISAGKNAIGKAGKEAGIEYNN
ncbi:MAG: serine hydrolase [Blastocatellia bacterium]